MQVLGDGTCPPDAELLKRTAVLRAVVMEVLGVAVSPGVLDSEEISAVL